MTVDATYRVPGLAFSPDGHHLLASYNDGLRLWNADTTQPEGTVMEGPGSHGGAWTVAYSRDGNILAAGLGDVVGLWDARTRNPLRKARLQVIRA